MDKKLIATRDGLGDELVELGKNNKDIYVVDVDIGKSCKTTAFAKAYPEQHVNVGIAEQNGAGLAAGLATCGKIPFVVTYAVFGSLRMCEQIRQEIPQADVAVLSRPGPAGGGGRKLPATCVIGASPRKTAEYLQGMFISKGFRVYTSPGIL